MYVHLTRNTSDTAASFVKRYSSGIIQAYRGGGILMGLPEESDLMAVASDYCDTVNSNIECFLKDRTKKMRFRLECAKQDFPIFWKLIGAEGQLESASSEFNVRYNASTW